ncbi:MAG: hypothetical protein U0Z53_22880 [Blastocatellia bacterium]
MNQQISADLWSEDPELAVEMLGQRTGFAVELICSENATSTGSFRIIPAAESLTRGEVATFWMWHVTANRQYFHEAWQAGVSFYEAWQQYLAAHQ